MHRPGRRLLEGGEGRRCRFCTPIFWGQLVHDFLVGGFKHGFYIFQKIYGDVIRQPLTNSIIFQAVFVVNLCEMMTSWRKWLNFSEHFFHHDVSKLVFFLMKHEIWGVPLFSEKKNIPSGYLTVCHGTIHHF
jgi:hypothetical protein